MYRLLLCAAFQDSICYMAMVGGLRWLEQVDRLESASARPETCVSRPLVAAGNGYCNARVAFVDWHAVSKGRTCVTRFD